MEHNTKLLGGIAYIVLLAFSVVGAALPWAGLISLAAAICVVVAFIQAGSQLGRPEVKQNIIIALVLYVVGVIIMLVVGVSLIAAFIANSGAGLAAIGVGAVLGGVMAWALSIVAAWFWYKASVPLAEATGVTLFKTGGLLMFIGAITVIVFGLGGVLTLVGAILQCVAFFNVAEKQAAGARSLG